MLDLPEFVLVKKGEPKRGLDSISLKQKLESSSWVKKDEELATALIIVFIVLPW